VSRDGGALKEMDLFKSFSDERLIEDWVENCEPPAFDVRWYATSAALREVRQSIYLRGLEDRKEVKGADISLIKCVLEDGAWPPDSDDPEKYPLSYWWWHLDKIAEKTYPPELLPEHLREIYQKAF